MNGNVKSLGFRFAFAWHTKRPIYPDWEKCPMSELFSIDKWGNLLDVIDHSLKPKKKKCLKRTIKIYHDQVVEVHFDWWYSCFYFRKYFAVPLRLREMCDRFLHSSTPPHNALSFLGGTCFKIETGLEAKCYTSVAMERVSNTSFCLSDGLLIDFFCIYLLLFFMEFLNDNTDCSYWHLML